MNITRRIAFILLITSVLLVSTGCDDIGVFAQIAVSTKLSEGLLPEGASPSKVMNINGGTGYDFISTGGRLWSRNISDREEITTSTRWKEISLDGWAVVQSIDQTDTYIVLTMVREDTNNHEVGLFYFDYTDFDPVTNDVIYHRVANTNWIDDGSSFFNVYVFCPNPGNSDEVFLNVLQTNDTFGQEYSYVNSLMYQESSIAVGDWSGAVDLGWTNLIVSVDERVRYVDSAAYFNDTTPLDQDYIFSVIENADEATDNGLLLDLAGNEHIDTSGVITRPVSGITYLPILGAYIGGGTELDDDNEYPIYVSEDLSGDNWMKVTGTSTAFRAQSFIDVSGTIAGGTGMGEKILAGTRSFPSTDAVGYIEIETEGHATPADWTVLSGGDRVFALPNNYLLSDLVDVSITAFSMYAEGGDDFIYASTATRGLWSINATSWDAADSQPRWKTE